MTFLAQPPVLAQNDSALLVFMSGVRHTIQIVHVPNKGYNALLDNEETGHQKSDLLDAVTGSLLVLYVQYGFAFSDIKELAQNLVSQYTETHAVH